MGPATTGDRMEMSLMYRVGGLPASVKDSFGGIRIGDRVVRWGPGFGGDGVDVENLTQAEVETRLKLWDTVQAMRKKPGMESLYLMQTATCIGVRETRRISGEYCVTEQDAIKGTRFPDVIAISSNPMPSYHGKRFFFKHEGFDIPYRSLVPKKVEGLVLSGRCISCEQAPFQSARSMAPAMAVGHASGCAAAMAATTGVAAPQARCKSAAETFEEPECRVADLRTGMSRYGRSGTIPSVSKRRSMVRPMKSPATAPRPMVQCEIARQPVLSFLRFCHDESAEAVA